MKARGRAQGPALRKVIRDDNHGEGSTVRALGDVLQELAQRATLRAFTEDGPMPAAGIESAANELRWTASSLRNQRRDVEAEIAERAADDLDETAELARLLSRREVAA